TMARDKSRPGFGGLFKGVTERLAASKRRAKTEGRGVHFEPLEPRLLLSADPAMLNIAAAQNVIVQVEQVASPNGFENVLTARDADNADAATNILDQVVLEPGDEKRALLISGADEDSNIRVVHSDELSEEFDEIRLVDEGADVGAPPTDSEVLG